MLRPTHDASESVGFREVVKQTALSISLFSSGLGFGLHYFRSAIDDDDEHLRDRNETCSLIAIGSSNDRSERERAIQTRRKGSKKGEPQVDKSVDFFLPSPLIHNQQWTAQWHHA